jgi:iron-sulfur cluster repair protein YtfE (RIC family)
LETIEIEEQQRSLGSALKPIVDELEVHHQIEEEVQFPLIDEEAVKESNEGV